VADHIRDVLSVMTTCPGPTGATELQLAELNILARLAPAELELLRRQPVPGYHRGGEVIVTEGETADRLYL